MARISRRTALGAVAAGIAGAAAGIALGRTRPRGSTLDVSMSAAEPVGQVENAIVRENRHPGSRDWAHKQGGTKPPDDRHLQISGYVSDSSVTLGGQLDFHVTTSKPGTAYTIAIYRFGYYGGQRARRLVTSPTLRGVRQPEPIIEPESGMISCGWPASWSLAVPATWTSGYHLAVFTTASGWRSYAPFVVRDDARRTGLLVVVPFATYQAYNQWPLDGHRGRSLYYGFTRSAGNGTPATADADPVAADGGALAYAERARKVCFDRPYARDGMPNRAVLDQDFACWAEGAGFDLSYASNIDLHTGRVDPTRYAGLVFSGHDEYWSGPMRDTVAAAIDRGTSVAFLSANNVYWHVRFDTDRNGPATAFTCYKTDADPEPDATGGTGQWRDPVRGPGQPEQALLGVQYNGIVKGEAPLVVESADHWFWAGTGVRNGDRINRVVIGEADGFFDALPQPPHVTRALLSASPYTTNLGQPKVQNTALYEVASGAIVFAASALTWPYCLSHKGFVDTRIQRATANVLRRMTRGAPTATA